METIKSYLEAMFANMPNTPEVRKAKAELLQMMEDKYNELIEEGLSENTAVGTVISEFGNLDELAEDLGLSKEVEEVHGKEADLPRRHINLEEAKAYLGANARKALCRSLGIMLTILSVAFPILSDPYDNGRIGAILMFLVVALGVGLIIYSGFLTSDWNFIKEELCQIDMNTASYLKEQRRSFESVRALCVTIGIILCIVCWIPNLIFTSADRLGAALMFLIVGIGVFLIVYANKISHGFDVLLQVNDAATMSGGYRNEGGSPVKYVNKTAETIMTLYWPTVTCIYLILSFLTFRWELTWIIWPVAGVAHRAVAINCCDDIEE
ncbi:MAG: permease prefix domain 1-containing protein [Lachnospiraceae bacterium]|nr:permease prefix domain 1-containing protein [Lachnospiraceae bacterium]